MKSKSKISCLLMITAAASIWSSCRQNILPPNPNEPPTTTMANIPVDGDTLFALVKLQWDGGDNDGYIAGFEYKYTTYYVNKGDSVVQDWKFTESSELTIAFNSNDILNKQRFQVRAKDDKGAVDPSPATKVFYTTQTFAPVAKILSPPDQQERFAIDHTTDWWQGVFLRFTGSDADGEIVEYGWSVDDNEWTWTQDTALYITPEHFKTPLTGQHTIRVTARDNTNITSLEGDAITLNLVEPTFDKDILIIDETLEKEFPPTARTTDAEVDSFYARIFGTDESWDYEYHDLRGQPLPPLSTIGHYKLLVWHADNRPGQNPHAFEKHREFFKDYLNVGGNLILSGWRILRSFAWDRNFPTKFDDTTFVNKYLHIVEADETPYYPGDFTGATGTFGFSHIKVDSAKLATFPYKGMLSQINVITRQAGFTEVLYRYRAPLNSQLHYVGQPCGLRYIGTSFNAIILGFPMYFIKEEDAKKMVDEILTKLGYR
jgi:hypothetical protein